jgi:hypothetical protein
MYHYIKKKRENMSPNSIRLLPITFTPVLSDDQTRAQPT